MAQNFASPIGPPGRGLDFIARRFSASLTGDVTMTTANTFYDGPTLLPSISGIYYLSGGILIQHDAAPSIITVRLWDGTVAGVVAEPSGSGVTWVSYPVSGFVTTDGTKTYKISATSTGNGAIIRFQPANNASGQKLSCYLNAFLLKTQ